MKKFVIYLLAGMLGVSAAIAETDYIANKRIDNIRKGTQLAKDRINDLYVADDAVINDDLIVTGNITSSGTVANATGTYVQSTNAAGTVLMLQKGGETTVLETTSTQTFTTVFSEAPWVVVTSGGDVTTNNVTVASNNFTVVWGATNITYNFVAIGLQP